MLLNKEQVKKYLPHREPFLFIDELEKVEAPISNQSIKSEAKKLLDFKTAIGVKFFCHYKTCSKHPIFAGHFPGNPILPGVVQVEMMAQGSSFFLLELVDQWDSVKLDVALVRILDSRFKKPIYPNMNLEIKTILTKARSNFVTSECSIYSDNELMSQATVMASLRIG